MRNQVQRSIESTIAISEDEGFWNRIIGEAIAIQSEPHMADKDTGLKLDNYCPNWEIINN